MLYMNGFHMTMVLKYGVEGMSLSQTNTQLEQLNEPCSGQSVHSYTSPVMYASGVTGLLCQTTH